MAFMMHGARKAKITKELENFGKDFGFCRQFILTSNTFTCFLLLFFSLFFFFFLFHIVCREKFKHIIYTNIMLFIQISTHLQLTKNQFLMIRYNLWSRHVAHHHLGILLEFYLRLTKVLLFWLLYLTSHVQTNRTFCKPHISRNWNK